MRVLCMEIKMRPAPHEGHAQDSDTQDEPGVEAPSGPTVEGPKPGSEQMQDIVQEADKKADKNVEGDTEAS